MTYDNLTDWLNEREECPRCGIRLFDLTDHDCVDAWDAPDPENMDLFWQQNRELTTSPWVRRAQSNTLPTFDTTQGHPAYKPLDK